MKKRIKAFKLNFDNIFIKNDYYNISYNYEKELSVITFNFNDVYINNINFEFNDFTKFGFSYILDKEIVLDVVFNIIQIKYKKNKISLISKEFLLDEDLIREKWKNRVILNIDDEINKL